jgi:hypothetical protein
MPLRSRSLLASRAMLAMAALDSVAAGSWALFWPDQVFALLQEPPPQDAFLLSALGALLIGQGLCLGAALLRTEAWGGFVWVAVLGRLILACVWLWLLGAMRIPRQPALLLIVHAVVWLPGFAVFLALHRRWTHSLAGHG